MKVISTDGDNVDVKVPLQLVRAGLKLTSLIPPQAMDQISDSMSEHGMSIDFQNLKPEDIEDLLIALREMEVNVDSATATTSASTASSDVFRGGEARPSGAHAPVREPAFPHPPDRVQVHPCFQPILPARSLGSGGKGMYADDHARAARRTRRDFFRRRHCRVRLVVCVVLRVNHSTIEAWATLPRPSRGRPPHSAIGKVSSEARHGNARLAAELDLRPARRTRRRRAIGRVPYDRGARVRRQAQADQRGSRVFTLSAEGSRRTSIDHTNAQGFASCTRWIPADAHGQPMIVTAEATSDGWTGTSSKWFVPGVGAAVVRTASKRRRLYRGTNEEQAEHDAAPHQQRAREFAVVVRALFARLLDGHDVAHLTRELEPPQAESSSGAGTANVSRAGQPLQLVANLVGETIVGRRIDARSRVDRLP